MQKRLGKLQELMSGVDCIIVTSPEDIFYYTGYMPMEEDGSILVVMEKCAKLFTIQNGFQKKRASVDITIMRKASDFYNFIKNYKVVGFDETHLLSRSYVNLKKHSLRLKPFSSIIKKPRMIKDRSEIQMIEKSIELTKKAFRLSLLGKTERDAAADIDCFFRRHYADNAFETIVASGINSSNVHYRPGNRKIGNNDIVIVDIGAKMNYCADLSRTFCKSPGKREKNIIENVKNIQEQLFDFIHPGIKFDDVQKEYERLMKKLGYRVFHLFGHGVGLNVHERPSREDVLEEGMVITVEPGIYIKNFGGCRIEDMILIKKKGIKMLS